MCREQVKNRREVGSVSKATYRKRAVQDLCASRAEFGQVIDMVYVAMALITTLLSPSSILFVPDGHSCSCLGHALKVAPEHAQGRSATALAGLS